MGGGCGEYLAARADKAAHVLHDTDDGELHLLAEVELFTHIGHGDLLRRGHDDRTVDLGSLQVLHHGDVLVGSTGWGCMSQHQPRYRRRQQHYHTHAHTQQQQRHILSMMR